MILDVQHVIEQESISEQGYNIVARRESGYNSRGSVDWGRGAILTSLTLGLAVGVNPDGTATRKWS